MSAMGSDQRALADAAAAAPPAPPAARSSAARSRPRSPPASPRDRRRPAPAGGRRRGPRGRKRRSHAARRGRERDYHAGQPRAPRTARRRGRPTGRLSNAAAVTAVPNPANCCGRHAQCERAREASDEAAAAVLEAGAVIASASGFRRPAFATPDLLEQVEQPVQLVELDAIVGGELGALPFVDRAGVDAAELVSKEQRHLALVEARRDVVEPAREVDGDVAPALTITAVFYSRPCARARAARRGSVRTRGTLPPPPCSLEVVALGVAPTVLCLSGHLWLPPPLSRRARYRGPARCRRAHVVATTSRGHRTLSAPFAPQAPFSGANCWGTPDIPGHPQGGDSGRRRLKLLQIRHDSSAAHARIAPRRSPVRVRLAPSRKGAAQRRVFVWGDRRDGADRRSVSGTSA
jgi:hypothetical protein